jgi:hypothetical protein
VAAACALHPYRFGPAINGLGRSQPLLLGQPWAQELPLERGFAGIQHGSRDHLPQRALLIDPGLGLNGFSRSNRPFVVVIETQCQG